MRRWKTFCPRRLSNCPLALLKQLVKFSFVHMTKDPSHSRSQRVVIASSTQHLCTFCSKDWMQGCRFTNAIFLNMCLSSLLWFYSVDGRGTRVRVQECTSVDHILSQNIMPRQCRYISSTIPRLPSAPPPMPPQLEVGRIQPIPECVGGRELEVIYDVSNDQLSTQ